MPTGFDKYNSDSERFEQSGLFRTKYAEFIDIISMPFGECKSRTLESMLKIPGVSVRRLVRHARQSGQPVISNQKGYCMARNFSELKPTIQQLEERGIDILNTVSKLKQCFPDENQLSAAI